MKKIILAILLMFTVVGCSSKENLKDISARLVVGKELAGTTLNDQHEKPQTISKDTKVVFFSFSKPMGHLCNEFLSKKPASFLKEHNAVYVADVSPAPTIVKNMFILPDLKELKFPILLINNDKLSAEFTKGLSKDSVEVVFLKDGKITKITQVNNEKDLEKIFTK